MKEILLFKFIKQILILNRFLFPKKLCILYCFVFVISFHSDCQLSVKINDILEGNMHKTALGIMFDHYYDEEDPNLAIDDDACDDHEVLKITLSPLKAYIFGVLNNSESRQQVELDFNKSKGYFCSPLGGVFKRKVNADRIEYLGASIGDKAEKKKKLKYEATAEEIEESDADESYYSDDSDREDTHRDISEEESEEESEN